MYGSLVNITIYDYTSWRYRERYFSKTIFCMLKELLY